MFSDGRAIHTASQRSCFPRFPDTDGEPSHLWPHITIGKSKKKLQNTPGKTPTHYPETFPTWSSLSSLRTCRQTSLGPVLGGVSGPTRCLELSIISHLPGLLSPTISVFSYILFHSITHLQSLKPFHTALWNLGSTTNFSSVLRTFVSLSCSKWTDSPLRKLSAFHSALWSGGHCALKDSCLAWRSG